MGIKDRIIRMMVARSGIFDGAFYIRKYADIRESWPDPASHYIHHGCMEGRAISEEFDIHGYINEHPLIIEWEMNPVLYYLLFDSESRSGNPLISMARSLFRFRVWLGRMGLLRVFRSGIKPNMTDRSEIEDIRSSSLFDAGYYLEQNRGFKEAGIDPAEHYYARGWRRDMDPSPFFDTGFYLGAHEDVRRSGMNPLLHYMRIGIKEGRAIKYRSLLLGQEASGFEHPDKRTVDLDKSPVQLICFHLPQFHRIPENDAWWGEGFTEWVNVKRARPQFDDHWQPNVPLDGNYYDLSEPQAIERQARMAREFGIRGFCFYHYWFHGKRLLETPVDLILSHPEWDIEFCICWANENWTRRWDGMDQDLLMAQKHSPEDDLAFIEDAARYLLDDRYIKVDGKPLLVIYRPALFPDMKATVSRWRAYFREKYGKELFLAMTQTFGEFDPHLFGMDAAIEFPPHNLSLKMINKYMGASSFGGRIFELFTLMNKEHREKPNYTLYKGMMLNWDNTPRKGGSGYVYLGNTPTRFADWLDRNIRYTLEGAAPGNLIFINAWNEWAEGTYLEPDLKYGYSYLNAIKRVLLRHIGDKPNPTPGIGHQQDLT